LVQVPQAAALSGASGLVGDVDETQAPVAVTEPGAAASGSLIEPAGPQPLAQVPQAAALSGARGLVGDVDETQAPVAVTEPGAAAS
jgi:PHD/YefM family antitoxin component YafN of YafNO toxin-antitoxin module